MRRRFFPTIPRNQSTRSGPYGVTHRSRAIVTANAIMVQHANRMNRARSAFVCERSVTRTHMPPINASNTRTSSRAMNESGSSRHVYFLQAIGPDDFSLLKTRYVKRAAISTRFVRGRVLRFPSAGSTRAGLRPCSSSSQRGDLGV